MASNFKIQNRGNQILKKQSATDSSNSQLFTKILEMIPRGELIYPRELLALYKEVVHRYIDIDGRNIHLITYLNIYNILTDSWLTLPDAPEDILFFTEKFSDKTVYESRKRSSELIQQKNIRSFRQYILEKGRRKYPIVLITRDSIESYYPGIKHILFQIPLTPKGVASLAEEMEIPDAGREGFSLYFMRLKKHFSDWTYLYYYIAPLKRESAVAGASIFTSDLIPQQQLLNLVELLDIIFAHIDLEFSETLLKNFSLRSAVAAIMSRNMSHNLGSHVLARIASRGVMEQTQNKGVSEILGMMYKKPDEGRNLAKEMIYWSKDAQLLALYVQQRMDFIAQVSSEWPAWTEPAYLLKNLVRGFLYQKHLLNFIAASEELGARLFHPRRHEENLKQYAGDIRLHVFLAPEEVWAEPGGAFHRKEEPGKTAVESRMDDILRCPPKFYLENGDRESWNPWNHVLLYTPEKGEPMGETTKDVLLAIPGGVVGYHAFYVILENIIRNAAKHGFAKGDADHLDIVIEVCYSSRQRVHIRAANGRLVPAWLLRIYDNVSFIRKKYGRGEVPLWGERDGEKGINDRLGLSVIQGGVKKEDWGLAEMKIAAGYLQQRSLEHIGKLAEAVTGRKISELPRGELDMEMLNQADSGEKGGSPIIRAVESPIGTLGYEFYVLRPQTVGIIDPEGGENV